MRTTPIHYTEKQGLYYRKPYIPKKLAFGVWVGLLIGNILGYILFSYHIEIFIISIALCGVLSLFKKITDGRMDYRDADSETVIRFETLSLQITHTFPNEPVENFSCQICSSESITHAQHYEFPYENIQHVFWCDNTFVLIVYFPYSSEYLGDSSSGRVIPISINCPITYYNKLNEKFFIHLREYPQSADLDYIVSYINAIR